MIFKEINKKFIEKVNEYLSKFSSIYHRYFIYILSIIFYLYIYIYFMRE